MALSTRQRWMLYGLAALLTGDWQTAEAASERARAMAGQILALDDCPDVGALFAA